MEGALRRLPPADVWLFADADLGASAVGLGALFAKTTKTGAVWVAYGASPGIPARIARDRIQILVDLKGYTKDARSEILA